MSFKLLKNGRAALVAVAICVAMVPTLSRAATTHYMPHADLEYSGGFIPTGGRH